MKKLILVLSLISLPALAADQTDGDEPMMTKKDGPCATDRAKFCGDVKPGKGRIKRCMKKHKKELSDSCRQAWKKRKKHRKMAMRACKTDVKKFCGDVERGKGRVKRCLKENKDKLSAECSAGMKKRKGKKHARKH